MNRLSRWYGESPLQLLLLAASFALAGYAGVRLLENDPWAVAVWFVGAALVHDLLLVPVYSLADVAAQEALGDRSRTTMTYVRVPAFLSGLLLLVWFPLITRAREDHYALVTGHSGDAFLPRWLLLTAALFAASALWFVAVTFLAPASPWRQARMARREGRERERERQRRKETKERPPSDH
ncbi:hypothetical protein OG758_40445 [Streptomyces sp. NBC_01474]|uniref:hypothetical protein n=1 Tax=unclassified Streptomyces TaxID=2593676 RepID=UPI002DDB7E72|nr:MULTISPECIES: hypothetical protein [unclassified Streptomyces]WSD99905.1 hypothetical protein OG758_40445 [Streptomyces sp. NBC_01474]